VPVSGVATAAAASPTVTTTGATSARPCVGSPAPARYDHVIWVVMENKAAGVALQAAQAPQTARLAGACAQASDYHAVTHPSLPNYLALTSGSTHGIGDDASPAVHRVTGSSLFAEVASAGGTWTTYAEAMPSPCAHEPAGRYAVKHNPAAYYVDLGPTCAAHDVPMGTMDSGAFADALQHDALPAFALVVPDLCDDTHDCSVGTGDAWLHRLVTDVTSTPGYAQGRTALFVTWDEDDGSHANRVGLLAIAPSVVPGTVDAHLAGHLSLLRTTEQLLGLPTTLVPRTGSMAADLGLLTRSTS
jgi:phospholipase C